MICCADPATLTPSGRFCIDVYVALCRRGPVRRCPGAGGLPACSTGGADKPARGCADDSASRQTNNGPGCQSCNRRQSGRQTSRFPSRQPGGRYRARRRRCP